MNPLLLILIEAGFEIGAAHAGSTGGAVIKTSGMLIKAARAIDELYSEEVGQPLDWSSLRHHDHLPPAGEPAEEFEERTDPGHIPIEEPDPDNPDPENPAES